jgi:methylglutaconyl-CoA hydratase
MSKDSPVAGCPIVFERLELNAMTSRSELVLEIDDRKIARLSLNRPALHNAFNAQLVSDLTAALAEIVSAGCRALVLSGEGESFSAGADLNWMKAMIASSEADNQSDARSLGALLRQLDSLPMPSIARVNGSAFGGGVGLIACCDIAVAVESAQFGLTEVRLGLVPATISPFVINRIGFGHARRYMLTGERLDALTAMRAGLINTVAPATQLDGHVNDLLDLLLAGGPKAQAEVKALLRNVQAHLGDPDSLDRATADLIARLRVSDEGQEGLDAFLNKRAPTWRA